jgi:hypothetical protein
MHTAWSGKVPRGHGAFAGAPDAEVALESVLFTLTSRGGDSQRLPIAMSNAEKAPARTSGGTGGV